MIRFNLVSKELRSVASFSYVGKNLKLGVIPFWKAVIMRLYKSIRRFFLESRLSLLDIRTRPEIMKRTGLVLLLEYYTRA
jgi:hypothetical protein